MPALSFSGEPERGPFYELIFDGQKKQTVRKKRKYPIKTGDFLKLYWKQRTPKDKKPVHFIGPAVCTHVETLPYRSFCYSDTFAIDDGFEDYEELQEWFGEPDGKNEDQEYQVIHFKLFRNCFGCDWCRQLSGQYVCAQGTHRFALVEPFRDKESQYLGCYELSSKSQQKRTESK